MTQDEVRRRYIEHERRRGSKEDYASAAFDRDIWPPPTPPLPLCAWGHQTEMMGGAFYYYVWCPECAAHGPNRPTQAAAIEAWEYSGKLAYQRGRVAALDDQDCIYSKTGFHEVDRELATARAELRRLQENRP